MTDTSTADLIKELKTNAERLGLTWQIRYATVLDGSVATAIVVTFDGDDASTPISAISLIGLLTAGERVTVMTVPPAGQYIIGRPAVSPAGTRISRVESATNSAAIGVGGAVALTLPSATYPNGNAFRVELGGFWFGSVANQASIQIYRNSSAGTLLQQFRTPVLPTTSGTAVYLNYVGYFRNESGLDITDTIVVFVVASAGTVTSPAGATFTRWAETQTAGIPTSYALSTEL